MPCNHLHSRRLLPFWMAVIFGCFCYSPVSANELDSNVRVGKRIENVTLHDAAGKPLGLHEFKSKTALVVVFLSFECPISTSYSQVLADFAKAYRERGVTVIGISGRTENTPAELAKLAQEYKIPFPVFADERQAAAQAFKAQVVPEAFVLDAHHVLRYRGRIDDSYVERFKKNQQITHHDLRNAIEDLLAGRPVRVAHTEPVGCPIHRQRVIQKTGKVTYYRDVLPILQNHCQSCHRPGEAGPFSLLTYRQAVDWADDLREYTHNRKMPPWKPTEGPSFQNERRLSEKAIATLAAWVDGGTPAGEVKDAPPPRSFPTEWQLGKPDLILAPSEELVVGASGDDVYRCFVLPTHLAADQYVVAADIRPGNPRVVHHALLYIDTQHRGRFLEKAQQKEDKDKKEGNSDTGPGYSKSMGIGFVPRGFLGGWAPGHLPRFLPQDTGNLLPKGADVVMQVHYHRDGRVEKDRTSVGLYFAKKPVSKGFQMLAFRGKFTSIPAGEAHFRVIGSTPPLAQDCVIHSVMPHMHLLGKEIKAVVCTPDGKRQTLVAIKDWDYNWQETYVFRQPLFVKAGTHFEVEAFYDNSATNPSNPFSPPKKVVFGLETTNEMCFVFMGATSDKPGRITYVRSQRRKDLAPKKATETPRSR